jgi:hypothetical protein
VSLDALTLARLDTLIVDAPLPPDTWTTRRDDASWPAWPSPAANLDTLLAEAVAAAATGRVGVLLDGSAASVLLGSHLRLARPDAMAVTYCPRAEAGPDDAGAAAAWLGLTRRHARLDRSLVETWARFHEPAGHPDEPWAPAPDLSVPSWAVAAQAAEVDTLFVPCGAAELLGQWPRAPFPPARDAARRHYGYLPAQWSAWRARLALRAELLAPEFVAVHGSAAASWPRAVLDPAIAAAMSEAEAQMRGELAGRLLGATAPLLATAARLSGVAFVAPFVDPTVQATALAQHRGAAAAMERLLRDHVPPDLLRRARRRPVIEPHWLLAATLPEPLRAAFEPAAVAAEGFFDPVTLAAWRQCVAAAPEGPLNVARARLLILAAGLRLRFGGITLSG